MKFLLIIHACLGLILIMTILLQKSQADSLSGISGNPMSSGPSVSVNIGGFMTKLTVFLAILFMISSLFLSRISYKKANITIGEEMEISRTKSNKNKDDTPNSLKIAE